MKVKIIRNYAKFKKDTIHVVTGNVGHYLIDNSIASIIDDPCHEDQDCGECEDCKGKAKKKAKNIEKKPKKKKSTKKK